VVGAVADRSVHVVRDQHEADDVLGHVAPRQRRRRFFAGLRVLDRNLTAVGPRARSQRHHLNRAASTASTPSARVAARRPWRLPAALRRLSIDQASVEREDHEAQSRDSQTRNLSTTEDTEERRFIAFQKTHPLCPPCPPWWRAI